MGDCGETATKDLNILVPDPFDLNNTEGKKDHNKASVSGTNVMALSNSRIQCNTPIGDLIKLIKPVIRALQEDSNLLKMWISSMIPKIEDGNNFGVSIQEDILAEIHSVETKAASFFIQISRYFVWRSQVVSRVAKYPYIDDYRRAVQELEEKEFFSLWFVLSEVRNRYCSLHDIIIKNMEKVKKPRSSHAER